MISSGLAEEHQALNFSPFWANAFCILGKEVLPIPCNASTSSSVLFDKDCKLEIPADAKARRAGADNSGRKSLAFPACFSQIGQLGQSLLL